MKRIATIIIFLVACLSTRAQSSDEKAVANAVEALRKALIDPDKKILTDITSADLSYGHSSWVIENQAAFIERLVSGDSDFKTIDLSEQTIKVVGNIAMVRHKLIASAADQGNPTTPKLGILLIFQKENGYWKMLARQATKLPQ